MGTSIQNSGSLTLNQAAEKNAEIRDLTCDELDAANKEARESETQKSFPGGAHTTAHRKDAAGNGKYMKAMCPNMPKAEFEEGYQDPVSDKNQPPCGGGRATSKGRRNDAENKILHPEMKAGKGGSIKMSTYHTGAKGPDAMPCYSCRQAICEAEACGIEVWLCKATNKPPEAVRPRAQGMCPPAVGQGDFDQSWANQGLGVLPS
jgi:hypothetical protein